jgi:hypothetical protein
MKEELTNFHDSHSVHREKEINHSQFADDTLLLGWPHQSLREDSNIFYKYFLRGFTEEKLIITKAKLYGWNIQNNKLRELSNIMGFPYLQIHSSFKYLGIPISSHHLKSQDWNPILEKMMRRIKHWGAHWLNPTGKIVLIKYVLSSLSIYQFTSILTPKGIMEKIAKLIRKFLWEGGKTNNKKYHLVNWATVKMQKERGGLEIRDPTLLNIALGDKIVWRFISGRQEWWKEAIGSIYFIGDRKRGIDKPLRNINGSLVWKLFKAVVPLIKSKLSWHLGNESIN